MQVWFIFNVYKYLHNYIHICKTSQLLTFRKVICDSIFSVIYVCTYTYVCMQIYASMYILSIFFDSSECSVQLLSCERKAIFSVLRIRTVSLYTCVHVYVLTCLYVAQKSKCANKNVVVVAVVFLQFMRIVVVLAIVVAQHLYYSYYQFVLFYYSSSVWLTSLLSTTTAQKI